MAEARIGRDALIAAMAAFLANQEPRVLEAIRAAVAEAIDTAGPGALDCLSERLATTGNDWSYYPADPLARHIHHVAADYLLPRESEMVGLEHLGVIGDAPVVICSNHLSYADANLIEVLLRRRGAGALADRLTVIAGPKVYSSLKRRFSSLCFGTIKTPQSSAVSSEDAVMNARDVVRAARRTLDTAAERLRGGDALVVFPEGTRSRTTGMQRFLSGVTRYFDAGDVWILPLGIVGSERMFAVGEDALHPVPVTIYAGAPIRSGDLRQRANGDRRVMIDEIGSAVARVLPPDYQGVYAPNAGNGAERAGYTEGRT